MSWLVRVWLQPWKALEIINEVPEECRRMGRLRNHQSYNSENINVIQRWALLLVGSICFHWLNLLSRVALSGMVVFSGGSQGHLSG